MIWKKQLTEKEAITFCTRLKELRHARNLTQKQAADIFFISRSAWGNYETGYRMPSHEFIKKVAEEFETDVNYVLGYENTNREIAEYIHRKMKSSKNITPEGLLDISDLPIIDKLTLIDYYEFLTARNHARKQQQIAK